MKRIITFLKRNFFNFIVSFSKSFSRGNIENIALLRNIKSRSQKFFSKKLFLKISQYLQENTCAGVKFLRSAWVTFLRIPFSQNTSRQSLLENFEIFNVLKIWSKYNGKNYLCNSPWVSCAIRWLIFDSMCTPKFSCLKSINEKMLKSLIVMIVSIYGVTGSKPGQVRFKDFWAHTLAWIEKNQYD